MQIKRIIGYVILSMWIIAFVGFATYAAFTYGGLMMLGFICMCLSATILFLKWCFDA